MSEQLNFARIFGARYNELRELVAKALDSTELTREEKAVVALLGYHRGAANPVRSEQIAEQLGMFWCEKTRRWIAMTIDPAISTKAWADFSAIAVCGFDRASNMHVLDLRHGKWSEGKLVDEIYDAWGKTPGIRAVGFEAVAFAKIYRREFTRAGKDPHR